MNRCTCEVEMSCDDCGDFVCPNNQHDEYDEEHPWHYDIEDDLILCLGCYNVNSSIDHDESLRNTKKARKTGAKEEK